MAPICHYSFTLARFAQPFAQSLCGGRSSLCPRVNEGSDSRAAVTWDPCSRIHGYGTIRTSFTGSWTVLLF